MSNHIVVTLAESAVQDLEAIREYYQGQEAPEVGDRFVEEIISSVGKLANHPDRGRMVPEFNNPQLRELIHPPFRIVYRRYKEKISVVRVWRSERLMRLP
ncbi:MAG: type II toxin-antitoxin system RelE/ParE family toxin [Deltaproteobacteria bacterium]|nr:MAG: type II toxin-antitoxin system RelE/ParE family toxin [Deltaproteobacteria bacterium]